MLELFSRWEVDAYCHSSGVDLAMLVAVRGQLLSCWPVDANKTRHRAGNVAMVVFGPSNIANSFELILQ